MSEKTYPGDTIARTFTFKDSNGTLFNPDTVAVLIMDPSGATVATQSISDLEHVSTGTYKMLYTLSSDAGNWNIKVTATDVSDGLVNEEFYPFTVYTSPTIPYAVVDVVKTILQVPETDGSKYNIEISDCLVSSTDFVNNLLKQKTLTVPSPTPQSIIDATNYFAAWMFRKRRDVQSAWIFYTDAERFLDTYIASQELPVNVGVVKKNTVGDDMMD